MRCWRSWCAHGSRLLGPKYRVVKQSACAKAGLAADDTLTIGTIDWKDDDHAEVPIDGRGAMTRWGSHRDGNSWRVDGPIRGGSPAETRAPSSPRGEL